MSNFQINYEAIAETKTLGPAGCRIPYTTTGLYHVSTAMESPYRFGAPETRSSAPMITIGSRPERLRAYNQAQQQIIIQILENLYEETLGVSAFESFICINWRDSVHNRPNLTVSRIIFDTLAYDALVEQVRFCRRLKEVDQPSDNHA